MHLPIKHSSSKESLREKLILLSPVLETDGTFTVVALCSESLTRTWKAVSLSHEQNTELGMSRPWFSSQLCEIRKVTCFLGLCLLISSHTSLVGLLRETSRVPEHIAN
jgi:hypothetical protein